jgi:AcrR family transcriptional regulator
VTHATSGTRAGAVERTRERILAVARDRFVELPYDELRLAEVAAAAGVTTQTLLNHFRSKEGLVLALVEALRPEIDALRGRVVPGDVPGFVRGLLRQYEALGDANVRWQAAAERVSALGEGLAGARAHHRALLEQAFAPDLPDEPRARRRTVAALYAVTDVHAWKLLRRDLGHSRAETAAVLTHLIRAALATAPS